MEKDQKALADAEAKAKQEQERAEKAEAAAKEATDKLAQFAESQRQATHASHVSFAEAEVQAGRLLPKDKGAAVAVLDLLGSSEPVSFAEGDTTKKVQPVEWLKTLISGAKPVVQFGEFANGNAGDQAAPADEAELDKRAKAYAKENKVSYAEALTAVVDTFTTSA